MWCNIGHVTLEICENVTELCVGGGRCGGCGARGWSRVCSNPTVLIACVFLWKYLAAHAMGNFERNVTKFAGHRSAGRFCVPTPQC